jgi:hypoxanthine-DNA glycosylase
MLALSFPPVISSIATVLILGSMPGVMSLKENEYYAHPRNLFWRIMDNLIGVPALADYSERIKHVSQAGIALWDSLKTCERPDSLDASIVVGTEEPNDFFSLLHKYPAIRAICFNGKKSEEVFRKQVLPGIPEAAFQRVDLIGLPSTSPANVGLSYEQKLSRWRVILDYLPVVPSK